MARNIRKRPAYRCTREELLRKNKYLKEKIKALESEIEAYRGGLMDFDPFKKLVGIKEITKFMGVGVDTLYKYRDQLMAVGAIGYENSHYKRQRRMIGLPFLIMKYYAKRNRQSKGYMDEPKHKKWMEEKNVQRSASQNT